MYPRFLRTDLLFLSQMDGFNIIPKTPYVINTTTFGAMLRYLDYDEENNLIASSNNEEDYPSIILERGEIIDIYSIDLMIRQNL